MTRIRLQRMLSLLLTCALLISAVPAFAIDADPCQNGHSWGEWDIYNEPGTCEDPTCEDPYYEVRWCHNCQKQETRTLTYQHNWSNWKVTKTASCGGEGKEQHTCSKCGKTQWRSIDREPHTWGEWELVTPPGELTVGKERRVCSVCGAEDWRDVYPDGTLKRGDRGDEVKALQEALNESGHDCGAADGIFGPKTENAVKDFQEENGYEGDGIAWPVVIGAVDKAANEPDLSSAFSLYVVDNLSPLGAGAGDTVNVRLGVQNVGGALLTLNMYEVHDGEGNNRSGIDSITGEWPQVLSQFAPGEDATFKLAIQVTEQDVLNGKITRTYTQYAKTWCWDDNGTLRPAGPGDIVRTGILTTRDVLYDLSQSVTIVIPLIASDQVTITKGTLDEPSNGQFYVEGEEITYMIMVENKSADAITDVEISDPLKGGNEDAILTLGETVNAGETREWEFTYTVTAEDVERGHIDNIASMRYVLNNDYVDVSSNTVTVPTGVEVAEFALQLELIEFAEAAYAPEEALPGKLRVTNTGAKPMNLYSYSITAGDAPTMFDTIQDFESMAIMLHPEQSVEFDFVIYASEGDFTVFNEVIRHIYMYGAPYIGNGESDTENLVASNALEVKAPAYYEVPEQLASITKEEISAPANGSHYLEGETIRYQISFTNNGGEELDGILIYDILDESGEATGIAHQFMPGETRSFEFEYTVTAFDVAMGEVVNFAVLSYPRGEDTEYVYSNAVFSPTGGEAFGVIEGLSIVKEETSSPANGSYYQEGETISYNITFTNTGEIMLGETIIYDSLKAGDIGSAEHLYPGEQRTVMFDYVVTAADVAAGCVVNCAIAGYDVGGFYRTVRSNEVCSPTNSDLLTEAPLPAIVLPVQSSDDFCVRTLEERSNAKNVFDLHYCSSHEATLQAVNAMVAAAQTAESKVAAWEYGIGLWQSDIAEMYAILMESANSTAKVTVLSEQLRFNALIANRKAMLDRIISDDSEQAVKMLAGIYEAHCHDLCYTLHTAPEARKDDLLLLPCGDGKEDACATNSTCIDPANYTVDECFCESHRTTNIMTETLLANGGTEEAWNWVEIIWSTDMTKEYKALKARVAMDDAEPIAIDARTYGEWVEAHRELLQLLYPEKGEIAAQISAKASIDRVRELCAEK